MQDRPGTTRFAGGRGNLQRASGIAGRDEVGLERRQIARPCARRARRRPRLDQVVDAGAAAAELGLGGLTTLESRNRAQQLARLAADALGVREMAGVVIRDPHVQSDDASLAAGRARRAARRRRAPAPKTRAPAPPTRGSSASSSPYSFIDDPHPAALTTMRSTPRRARRPRSGAARSRAPRRAGPRAARARRSTPAPAGATTSQPSGASTLTVAWLTCANTSRCTQPVEQADRQRRSPTAGVRSGGRAINDASDTGGASVSSARTRAGSQAPSPDRPSAGADAAEDDAAARARCAVAPDTARRGTAPSETVDRRSPRVWWRSICARVRSMSGPYCTPDGHAVTHAMQPEARVEVPDEGRRSDQRARRDRPSSDRCGRAASPSPRPRASRSGSSGRQNPQCTHLSISAVDGASWVSKTAGGHAERHFSDIRPVPVQHSECRRDRTRASRLSHESCRVRGGPHTSTALLHG